MARGIPKEVLERLAELPVFRTCSKRELEIVSRIGTPIPIEPGYVLTRQGRRGYEFFVILTGEASCTIDDKHVARLGPGNFFGEMSLVEHDVQSATVVAETAMEVIAFDAREFSSMLDQAPSTARTLLATVAHRLREAQSPRSEEQPAEA